MKNQALVLHKLVAASLALAFAAAAGAQVSSSTNYQIRWDTFDAGGGRSTSTNYTLEDSIGVVAAGRSNSANYALAAGFQSPPDDDGDRVRSFLDNCIFDLNNDQRDTNGDGFGNVCDADLNNDGIVNAIDLGLLRLVFFTGDADADFNGDGIVNAIDLGVLKLRFFTAPGPSGIAP